MKKNQCVLFVNLPADLPAIQQNTPQHTNWHQGSCKLGTTTKFEEEFWREHRGHSIGKHKSENFCRDIVTFGKHVRILDGQVRKLERISQKNYRSRLAESVERWITIFSVLYVPSSKLNPHAFLL